MIYQSGRSRPLCSPPTRAGGLDLLGAGQRGSEPCSLTIGPRDSLQDQVAMATRPPENGMPRSYRKHKAISVGSDTAHRNGGFVSLIRVAVAGQLTVDSNAIMRRAGVGSPDRKQCRHYKAKSSRHPLSSHLRHRYPVLLGSSLSHRNQGKQ